MFLERLICEESPKTVDCQTRSSSPHHAPLSLERMASSPIRMSTAAPVSFLSGTGSDCIFRCPFLKWTAQLRNLNNSLITDTVNSSLPADLFDCTHLCFTSGLKNWSLHVNDNYSYISTLLLRLSIGNLWIPFSRHRAAQSRIYRHVDCAASGVIMSKSWWQTMDALEPCLSSQ